MTQHSHPWIPRRPARGGAGRTLLAALITLVTLAVPATPAAAQDYSVLIQQGMARMDRIVNQAQGQVAQVVQQRMHDPAVQAAWQRYLQQTGGRPAMDYPSFTYWYVYTNGFSASGMAHARANEAGIQAREQAAWQGYRQAQDQRAQAQQAQRDGYYRHQQEAGRQLMGQGTFQAANGQTAVLPQTWGPNTTHVHHGQTYHVDAGGHYYVHAGNGWWMPLVPAR